MTSPRVIFAGTPDFAATALQAIVKAGFCVPLVLTQPDRPKGRGMKPQASAVKIMAQSLNLDVAQPISLKEDAVVQLIKNVHAGVMVVAAYGLILPESILKIPPYGCLNIHASLLPRWRGAAPIQRAIEAGDKETGVCIMQMDAGLDTGDVVHTLRYTIQPDDTAQTVHDALSILGANAIVATLQQISNLSPTPQQSAGVTYAKKLTKSEAQIDWQLPASTILCKIRAFNPTPVAWTLFKGSPIKIWAARIVEQQGIPGQIISIDKRNLIIACGEQALAITMIQPSGSKVMPIAAFLAGNTLSVGDSFANQG